MHAHARRSSAATFFFLGHHRAHAAAVASCCRAPAHVRTEHYPSRGPKGAAFASPSPASTTASAGDAACSFGAMYSSPSTLPQATAVLARYDGAATAPLPPPPPPQQQQQQASSLAEFSHAPPQQATATTTINSWAGGLAIDDMFLPELLGVGDFLPGDIFGVGLAPQLQADRASSLQELAACYFPSAQAAEMWAAADHVKPPPQAGLCHSLT